MSNSNYRDLYYHPLTEERSKVLDKLLIKQDLNNLDLKKKDLKRSFSEFSGLIGDFRRLIFESIDSASPDLIEDFHYFRESFGYLLLALQASSSSMIMEWEKLAMKAPISERLGVFIWLLFNQEQCKNYVSFIPSSMCGPLCLGDEWTRKTLLKILQNPLGWEKSRTSFFEDKICLEKHGFVFDIKGLNHSSIEVSRMNLLTSLLSIRKIKIALLFSTLFPRGDENLSHLIQSQFKESNGDLKEILLSYFGESLDENLIFQRDFQIINNLGKEVTIPTGSQLIVNPSSWQEERVVLAWKPPNGEINFLESKAFSNFEDFFKKKSVSIETIKVGFPLELPPLSYNEIAFSRENNSFPRKRNELRKIFNPSIVGSLQSYLFMSVGEASDEHIKICFDFINQIKEGLNALEKDSNLSKVWISELLLINPNLRLSKFVGEILERWPGNGNWNFSAPLKTSLINLGPLSKGLLKSSISKNNWEESFQDYKKEANFLIDMGFNFATLPTHINPVFECIRDWSWKRHKNIQLWFAWMFVPGKNVDFKSWVQDLDLKYNGDLRKIFLSYFDGYLDDNLVFIKDFVWKTPNETLCVVSKGTKLSPWDSEIGDWGVVFSSKGGKRKCSYRFEDWDFLAEKEKFNTKKSPETNNLFESFSSSIKKGTELALVGEANKIIVDGIKKSLQGIGIDLSGKMGDIFLQMLTPSLLSAFSDNQRLKQLSTTAFTATSKGELQEIFDFLKPQLNEPPSVLEKEGDEILNKELELETCHA